MKRYITIFILALVATFFIGRTSVLSNELKATKAELAEIKSISNEDVLLNQQQTGFLILLNMH